MPKIQSLPSLNHHHGNVAAPAAHPHPRFSYVWYMRVIFLICVSYVEQIQYLNRLHYTWNTWIKYDVRRRRRQW